MVVAHHVDEVHDDDAAQIAQPELSGNGLRGFEVRLEDRVVEIAGADEAAGVDIDRGQRLGLVNHQVAARLELDAAAQRLGDLFVDCIEVEDRAFALVVLQLAGRLRHELDAELVQHIELLARIDADGLRVFAGHVAQHALQQAQVLVQQRHRRHARRRFANARPGLAQIRDVFRQFGIGRVFAVGAQDEATGARRHDAAAVGRCRSFDQHLHAGTQRVALVRWNLLRHADVIVLRQKDQQASGDADLRREARALGADRVLDDLDEKRLPFEHLLLDRHDRTTAAMVPLRHLGACARAGGKRRNDVGHMQERRALQADIDKGRLHAGQHARHLAEVDVADQPALQRAFDVQFLHRAVLHQRHSGLLRGPVDQDVLHGFF